MPSAIASSRSLLQTDARAVDDAAACSRSLSGRSSSDGPSFVDVDDALEEPQELGERVVVVACAGRR